jgi:hypothetical protein
MAGNEANRSIWFHQPEQIKTVLRLVESSPRSRAKPPLWQERIEQANIGAGAAL